MTRRQYLAVAAAGLCRAAEEPLVAEWRNIAAGIDGTAGAAALHVATGRRAGLNAAERFPLASVCKLPMAMIAFAMVAEGKLSLSSDIEVARQDVTTNVSPIGERWLRQKKWKLDRMVELMVAKSDNTAVQTLYRLEEDGAGITARLSAWGIKGIRIDRDERTAGLDLARQGVPRFLQDPRDTATPDATVDLIQKALHGRALPDALTVRLRAILESTTTGPGRIKGLLPPGTVVAHKTGTTGSKGNLNGSTNDVGAIRLPNGGDLIVAFYLKGSARDLPDRERTIARLAKAAYDWSLKL